MPDKPFWKHKSLTEMTDEEWESLCDGCARCCLQKLEDVDTGEIAHTRIACRLLDCDSCRCGDYVNRQRQVPDCVVVRPLDEQKLSWLPASCAYRRLAEGRDLAPWHPLVSGNPDSVHSAGVSVKSWALPEMNIEPVEWVEHIIVFDNLPS